MPAPKPSPILNIFPTGNTNEKSNLLILYVIITLIVIGVIIYASVSLSNKSNDTVYIETLVPTV